MVMDGIILNISTGTAIFVTATAVTPKSIAKK